MVYQPKIVYALHFSPTYKAHIRLNFNQSDRFCFVVQASELRAGNFMWFIIDESWKSVIIIDMYVCVVVMFTIGC